MPECMYHCKGVINWKAAMRNGSRDDSFVKTSEKLVLKSIRMKRLNVVVMTIMFHRLK